MLTDKDMDKLVKVFATKDDVRTIVQEEIADLKKSLKNSFARINELITVFNNRASVKLANY